MLILNSRRLIYVHLNKNAGTAVEASLAPLLKWNDILLGSTDAGERLQLIYQSMFGLHKHSCVYEIVDVIGDAWKEYFSFATVRNPYERTASLYCYAASLVEDQLIAAGFQASATIEQIRSWRAGNAHRLGPEWGFPAVIAYLETRNATRPFSEFLRNGTLLVAEPAFGTQHSKLVLRGQSTLAVSEVIKMEELQSVWQDFLHRNGIPVLPLLRENETLPRLRKSFGALTTDPADYRLLNTRFEIDFDSFGYRRHPG
jgi:hypothetical protein